MFSEGLDRSALRWVREGARIDPVHGFRNGCRSFGPPPTDKFRSGHLPSRVIPLSHGDADESGSGSDMDETTDTEEEAYGGGRYSLDSSPQDERAPDSNTSKSKVPQPRLRQNYSNASLSAETNSLRDKVRRPPPRLADNGRGVNGVPYHIGNSYYSESEMSDSAGSTEFSSSRIGSKNGDAQSRGSYPEESCSSNAASRVASRFAAEKDHFRRDSQRRDLQGIDVPSAPPFQRKSQEIKQELDGTVASRKCSSSVSAPLDASNAREDAISDGNIHVKGGNSQPEDCIRHDVADPEAPHNSGSFPARLPTFHASGQGPWHAVIAYDACVRLCLHSWARGLMEAPVFLENECALLRSAFSLQHILLQSEEELFEKKSSNNVHEQATAKPKKTIGKMKVQVRKVKMSPDMPTGCSFSSFNPPRLRLDSFRARMSCLQTEISSGWEALKKVRVVTRTPVNGSFSTHSLAYVHASAQYIKQVSKLLKTGVTTLRSSSSYDSVQEIYTCHLKLKSSLDEEQVRMQCGSGEAHVFFPDSLGDDLTVEIYDSKGKSCGRVLAQVARVADDPGDKLRWWSIYHEPEHELVGRLQLYINYATCLDENSSLKCGSVAETVAYDLVLEVAMKVQHFQQRNLYLHGPWKWLLAEFASYYGVSDAYTKLRYLSYVMDVATPTSDCLTLIYDLLSPVILNGRGRSTLSHQENRLLGDIEDQIDQVLSLTFENYKSLDESLPSGIVDSYKQSTGSPAPALGPAIKLYSLIHDVLSPEVQLKLCSYFQVAAKKRARRHLMETDEYVTSGSEGILPDVMTVTTAYQKMRTLCLNMRNEIYTDIEIHGQHVLPSFVDLPNTSASIYSAELCKRLRSFLVSCPPTGPSPPVADLVIATADFERDLDRWNICPVKEGVNAKELFHLYIVLWIQDKRLSLLESCKLDKIKWAGVRTQHSTTPFIEDMYDRLKETLNEYEVITCRWPEYTFVLENAVADVEKAILEALDKQYADVLLPLKDALTPKKFGLKYVQKLALRNSMSPYIVPEELGVLLNTLKRLLDVLRPRIESQLKSWGSCIPDGGSTATGDRLSEVTVLLRAKFRNYVQAVVEKLAENTRSQAATKMKRIIQDSKDNVTEADIRSRMQPLKDMLMKSIDHLHTVFVTHVFVSVCRGFWDRMGQDVLGFLENKKESRSWYKSSRIAVAILDDTFASQLQQLLGNGIQEKDIEPPRSIMEVRSMLCKDAPNPKESNFFY